MFAMLSLYLAKFVRFESFDFIFLTLLNLLFPGKVITQLRCTLKICDIYKQIIPDHNSEK